MFIDIEISQLSAYMTVVEWRKSAKLQNWSVLYSIDSIEISLSNSSTSDS